MSAGSWELGAVHLCEHHRAVGLHARDYCECKRNWFVLRGGADSVVVNLAP